MVTENPRRIPLDKAASFDEIIDAINSLTPVQLKRLEKFAKWRVRGLGKKKLRRDWEDLFQDAITSFCSEDRRRWNKEKVDFVTGLIGAMRSISDNWKRSYDENEPKLEIDLITTSQSGKESNPLNNVPVPNSNVQNSLEAREQLEAIEKLVAKRELAGLIILGLADKLTGTEICKDLGITRTQYETEITWIRRTVRAAFKE